MHGRRRPDHLAAVAGTPRGWLEAEPFRTLLGALERRMTERSDTFTPGRIPTSQRRLTGVRSVVAHGLVFGDGVVLIGAGSLAHGRLAERALPSMRDAAAFRGQATVTPSGAQEATPRIARTVSPLSVVSARVAKLAASDLAKSAGAGEPGGSGTSPGPQKRLRGSQ